MEGGAIFFNYTITSPELGNIILEESDAGPLKMMWGKTMMCLPEVYLALRQVHPLFIFCSDWMCRKCEFLVSSSYVFEPPMVGGWITPPCGHASVAAVHQKWRANG
jgi:hypothetical protein